MVGNIIDSANTLEAKFDDLVENVQRNTYSTYKSVEIDNTEVSSFVIAPYDESEQVSGMPDMSIGTATNKFGKISLNDTIMIKDSSIFLKIPSQVSSENPSFLSSDDTLPRGVDPTTPGMGMGMEMGCRQLNATDTQQIIDIIKSLNVHINNKSELIINDNFQFLCQGSNKQIYMNLTKLIASLVVFTQSLESRILQSELKDDLQNSRSTTSDVSNSSVENIQSQLTDLVTKFESHKTKESENMSALKNISQTNTKKVNELWNSVLELISNTQNTVNTQIHTVSNEFKDFHEFKDRMQSCVENCESAITSNELRLNDVSKIAYSTYDLHCVSDTDIIGCKKDLLNLKQKLISIDNTVVDHSKRVRQMDNVDIQIKTQTTAIFQKLDTQQNELSVKLIDSTNNNEKVNNEFLTFINELRDQLNDVNRLQDVYQKDYQSNIETITHSCDLFEVYVKNGLHSMNVQINEMKKNMTHHLDNASHAIDSTQKDLNQIHSNLKISNDTRDSITESHIKGLIAQSTSTTNEVNILTSKLEIKDTKIQQLEQIIIDIQKDVQLLKSTSPYTISETSNVPPSDVVVKNISTRHLTQPASDTATHTWDQHPDAQNHKEPLNFEEESGNNKSELFKGSLPKQNQPVDPTSAGIPKVFTTSTKRLITPKPSLKSDK